MVRRSERMELEPSVPIATQVRQLANKTTQQAQRHRIRPGNGRASTCRLSPPFGPPEATPIPTT